MLKVLIVGATQGLGASLANEYAKDPATTVFATTRSLTGPDNFNDKIQWIPNIDVTKEGVGDQLINQLGMHGEGDGMIFNAVIFTAGYFTKEILTEWEEEVKLYTTSVVSPPFIVHSLLRSRHLSPSAKIILISPESGSTLRAAEGNYGLCVSTAALSEVGRLLALELKQHEIIVSTLHPPPMVTETTEPVDDFFWDNGGALTLEEAAVSLVTWVGKLNMGNSGKSLSPSPIAMKFDLMGGSLGGYFG